MVNFLVLLQPSTFCLVFILFSPVGIHNTNVNPFLFPEGKKSGGGGGGCSKKAAAAGGGWEDELLLLTSTVSRIAIRDNKEDGSSSKEKIR